MSNTALSVDVGFVKQVEYPQWLPHWNSYQTFYRVKLSDDVTTTTWSRFFDDNEKMYCAVARDGQQVVGFVHFLYHRSTWAVEDYCYLEDLFVSADCRGKQVGKRLIEFVHQHAKKAGTARLYWHTQESNLTAHKLYDWLGERPGVIEYRMPL